jgi:plasmid stabilization system protein ParE
MAYNYVFDPIAADEYEEALKWYEERSETAADNLIISIQNAINAICTDPYRYRNTYKSLRELTIRKYPYHLVYFIDDESKIIIITSFYHHKRNPKGKYNKSKKK